MKKFNLLLLLVVTTLGLTSITSCNPDTESAKPTLSFIAEGASVTQDESGVELGAPLLFKMSLDQSIDTKKKIKTLSVKSISNNNINVDTLIDVNKDNTIVSLTFNAVSTYSTSEKFTFTIEDNAGVQVTKTIEVTTKSAPVTAGTITTFSATLLGAQDNPTLGSFLDLHSGTVHLTSSANANSADIDLIYYSGATNPHTFVAPTDATVNGGASNLSMATGMTAQNATAIAVSAVTGSEFDAMSDDGAFPTAISTTTLVNNNAVGDVLEFMTQDGKIGLLKVTALSGTNAGTITIDVKIQD